MSRLRWGLLALGLLAALPILFAAVYAVLDHWTAIGDDAFVGIRAYDVFTDRSPLVGQRSSGASDVVREQVYSPGPLLFWLLAIPVRLPDPIFMTLTTAAVNVAAVAGVVALALRRGGALLAATAAIAIPVMLASLPAETYADIWNSSAPLMPLTLLVFVAWSVACGEYRLLPLAVLLASFAVQSHLTFAAPVALIAVVSLTTAIVMGSARRWPRAWVLAGLVVAAVCWSAPAVDEVIHRPGNLSTLVDSATSDDQTIGWSSGWKAMVHTVGFPPWWLEDDRTALERIGDLTRTPGRFAIASTVVLLLVLAAITAVGWRRRSADLAAAGAVGIALPLATGLAASSTPVDSFATVYYTLRWASPAGMCVWLLAGWGLAVVAGARLPARASSPRVGLTAALVAAALAGTAVAIGETPPRREAYKPMRAIAGRLEAALPPSQSARVEPVGALGAVGLTSELTAGTVFWLRRHGRSVVTTPDVADRIGSAYARGSYQRVVRIFVDKPPPSGKAVLAAFQILDEVDEKTVHHVAVTLSQPRR